MFRKLRLAKQKKSENENQNQNFKEVSEYFGTIQDKDDLRSSFIEQLHSRFTEPSRLENIKQKLKKKYPNKREEINLNFNLVKAKQLSLLNNSSQYNNLPNNNSNFNLLKAKELSLLNKPNESGKNRSRLHKSVNNLFNNDSLFRSTTNSSTNSSNPFNNDSLFRSTQKSTNPFNNESLFRSTKSTNPFNNESLFNLNSNRPEKEKKSNKTKPKPSQTKFSGLNRRNVNSLRLIQFANEHFIQHALPQFNLIDNLKIYFPFYNYLIRLRGTTSLADETCLINLKQATNIENPDDFIGILSSKQPSYSVSNVSGDGHCSIWAFIFGYLMNYNNFNNTRLEPFLNLAQTYISIIKNRVFEHTDFKPSYILLALHFYFLWVGIYYYDIFLQINNGTINLRAVQNKFLNYLPYSAIDLEEISSLINYELNNDKGDIAIKTYYGFLLVSKIFNMEQILVNETDRRNNVLQFFITAQHALTRNIGTVDYVIFNYLSFLLDTPVCVYKLIGPRIQRSASLFYNGNYENVKEKINIYGSGSHFFSINTNQKYEEFLSDNVDKSLAILWWKNMRINPNRLRINEFPNEKKKEKSGSIFSRLFK